MAKTCVSTALWISISALLFLNQTVRADDFENEKVSIAFATKEGIQTNSLSWQEVAENQEKSTKDKEATAENEPLSPAETFDGLLMSEPIAESSEKTIEKSTSTKYTEKSFKIISIGNWPEYKMASRMKTVGKVFGRKIKVKVPQAFRRHCDVVLYAKVKYPLHLDQTMGKSIEKCGTIAAAAAVVVGAATGASGALPAFSEVFQECMKNEVAKEFKVSVEKESKCGKWVPY